MPGGNGVRLEDPGKKTLKKTQMPCQYKSDKISMEKESSSS